MTCNCQLVTTRAPSSAFIGDLRQGTDPKVSATQCNRLRGKLVRSGS